MGIKMLKDIKILLWPVFASDNYGMMSQTFGLYITETGLEQTCAKWKNLFCEYRTILRKLGVKSTLGIHDGSKVTRVPRESFFDLFSSLSLSQQISSQLLFYISYIVLSLVQVFCFSTDRFLTSVPTTFRDLVQNIC